MRPQFFSHLTEARQNNFDFFRVFFAALVIFAHSYFLTRMHSPEPMQWLSHNQADFGAIAVDGFFVISGFLITASWFRSQGLGSYLRKRVLRIYPGFMVACLFCALIAGPLGAVSATAYFHEFSWSHFFRELLLLSDLHLPATFPNSPIPDQVNGSLWTIKIEFECYLLVAVLGILKLLQRRQVSLVLFLCCLSIYGSIAFHAKWLGHPRETVESHIRFFSFYLAGMVFYLYRDQIPFSRRWAGVALLTLVVAAITQGLKPMLAVSGVYLLMYASFHPAVALHRFSERADLSYGLYLYAWPVQQLIGMALGTAINPLLLFVLSSIVASGLATVSWFLVEKPCLRLKNGRSSQAREAAT